ncbi:MAG TPA: hypothetical protein VNZ64_27135 [Candidatus Acidoferrum sp.]|jgi:hypothetical protein|nr:hypothetical protein [Candidatus Acidoferrum sp.]
MPIRINLLAEARALEDLRRRDPVKRATLVGLLLVIALAAFSSWLQLQVMMVRGEVTRVEGQIATRSKEFQQVLDDQRNLADATRRLGMLHQLATNRLLYGTLLNALQQTIIDDVQLTKFRTEQTYVLSEGVKPKTNADNRVIPGRPASVTEKVVLSLEAKDSGPNPGDQVNKFKQTMADFAYFRGILGKTNEFRLTSLSPPQALDGKPFVQFGLECRYPEKTR